MTSSAVCWYVNDYFVFFLTEYHVTHLQETEEEELNRLLGIVVDVENLFVCVHKVRADDCCWRYGHFR